MKTALLLLGAVSFAAAQTSVDQQRVERVLDRAVILDLHDDTTQMILDENYNMAESHTFGQVDIPRLKKGRIGGLFMSIWVDSVRYTPAEATRRALEEIDAVRRETLRHPADLALAVSADEIVAAKRAGKVAILMGVEGGHIINSDLALLRTFYQLGARYMTLTHTTHTPWADSASLAPAHNGLTEFGRQVVREMNQLGMMVDVSHVSDKTFADVLETSTAPVIASHSSSRALAGAARNMTDDMLRAIARKGGVVHVNFFESFLDSGFGKRFNEQKEEQAEAGRIESRAPKFGDRNAVGPAERKVNAIRAAKAGRVPLSRLLDHFDHVIKVAGIDHVGIGSDFDGSEDQFPEGMEDISKIPNLVRGLMERGYSDDDILKVLGGNTLRVMREVEKAARH